MTIFGSRKSGYSFTFTNVSFINHGLLVSLTFQSLRTCFDTTAAKKFLGWVLHRLVSGKETVSHTGRRCLEQFHW